MKTTTPMDLEILNKLYLELSKCATAKTERELLLEDLIRSARCIAQRHGQNTDWERFDERLRETGIGCVTPRVFKVVPADRW